MKFENLQVKETDIQKCVSSSDYNYEFDKDTGYFVRYGKTIESIDDPEYAPFPEILDIEISTTENCQNCHFCYKSNSKGQENYNMSFEDFKNIIDKVNEQNGLTQIAVGICNISTNPDFFKMMEYSKSIGVIPNYTCNGFEVNEEIAKKTADICGAVAVSIVDKETSYNAIQHFTNAGMTQVNIHQVIYEENIEHVYSVLEDIKNDSRLSKMNAIVFLSLKKKGGAKNTNITQLSQEKYTELVNYCLKNNIRFGMDSCGAHKFLDSVKDHKYKELFEQLAEPCESSCMSAYINCKGEYYPCSFCEDENGWENGIDVNNCESFVNDVWNHPRTVEFREKLLKCGRKCPIFKI